jgi:hypothetical protein
LKVVYDFHFLSKGNIFFCEIKCFAEKHKSHSFQSHEIFPSNLLFVCLFVRSFFSFEEEEKEFVSFCIGSLTTNLDSIYNDGLFLLLHCAVTTLQLLLWKTRAYILCFGKDYQ